MDAVSGCSGEAMGVIWRRGICGGFCMGFFDSSSVKRFRFIIPNRIKQCILYLLSLVVVRAGAPQPNQATSPVLKTRL